VDKLMTIYPGRDKIVISETDIYTRLSGEAYLKQLPPSLREEKSLGLISRLLKCNKEYFCHRTLKVCIFRITWKSNEKLA
jgi:hypothetical protein